MGFDVRNDTPMVSVCLITYNHASYISECLDSILMQETGFPYEICLGEDESNDGTREICIEYAEKHPDRIRLILRSQSEPGRELYMSQGVYNYIETTKICSGKYLALCDGDDAWTDPLKLQKQLDIMEADPSISLVHSEYDRVDELSGKRLKNYYREKNIRHESGRDKSEFIFDLIQRNYPIAASTVFMRTADVLEIFENNPELFRKYPMGDVNTWCELVNYGCFYMQKESMAIYRLHPHSESNPLSPQKKIKFMDGTSNLGLMIGEKYNLPMNKFRSIKVKNCNRYALLSNDRSEISRLYEDGDYEFSFPERCIYLATRFKLIRPLAKKLYELRFYVKHRLSCIR